MAAVDEFRSASDVNPQNHRLPATLPPGTRVRTYYGHPATVVSGPHSNPDVCILGIYIVRVDGDRRDSTHAAIDLGPA